MPFMPGDADLNATDVDIVLDDSRYDYPLFTLPNRAVSDGGYATARHGIKQ